VESGAAVTATVYDDYSLEVVMPASGSDAVYYNQVTISMKMQNVSSLGVAGRPKTYTNTVSTGLNTGYVYLKNFLTSCYNFTDGTINFNIGRKSCTYEFARDGYVITGTPTNVEETRTAWQELTSHVDAGEKAVDDSFITIKNGSYLQVGNELLSFDETYVDEQQRAKDLVLNDFSKLSDMKTEILKAVKLTEKTSDGNDITGFLKAGTTLAVSNSQAMLLDNATITISGLGTSKTYPNASVDGMLSGLQSAVHTSTTETIQNLVAMFDYIVSAVDGSDAVTVTIDFD
jgi:hypothetical protein